MTCREVTTQIIILIKKYEKIIVSSEEKEYDKETLKKVVHEMKQELYKYSPSTILKLEE